MKRMIIFVGLIVTVMVLFSACPWGIIPLPDENPVIENPVNENPQDENPLDENLLDENLLDENLLIGTWLNSILGEESYLTFYKNMIFQSDILDDVWIRNTGTYEYDGVMLTISYNGDPEVLVFTYIISEDTLTLTNITGLASLYIRSELPETFIDTQTLSPLIITDASIVKNYYKELHISFRNDSDKTIIAAKIYALLEDAFGDNASSYSDYFLGYFDSASIEPLTTYSAAWYLFSYDTATTIVEIGVYEIAFEDGTTWEDLDY